MKESRKVTLSLPEIETALKAISQMTDGNARNFKEWQKQTSGDLNEWTALLRAEKRLKETLK